MQKNLTHIDALWLSCVLNVSLIIKLKKVLRLFPLFWHYSITEEYFGIKSYSGLFAIHKAEENFALLLTDILNKI